MFACLGKKKPGQTCIVPIGFGFEIRVWNCQRRLPRKEETTLPETGEGGTRTRESSHARLANRDDRESAHARGVAAMAMAMAMPAAALATAMRMRAGI
jgi:hypothetical protein